MDKRLFIVIVILQYSPDSYSQQNTLIACRTKRFGTVKCSPGEHIVLDSIILYAKDKSCSSHTRSSPSAQYDCCKLTTGDKQLTIFELPSDDPTMKTKFNIAINSCSFDRDSCIIPTRADVFQMDYGGRHADIVAYKYRCVHGTSAHSLCGGTSPVSASSVVVSHDGAASGAAVDCQCSMSSSCNSLISVRILYTRNTHCSLQLTENNSSRDVNCVDSVAVSHMESVGHELMLKINSSDSNYIALEFSATPPGTQGSIVSVTCGRNIQAFPEKSCPSSTSTSTTLTTASHPAPQHILNSVTTQRGASRPPTSFPQDSEDSTKYVIVGCVIGAVLTGGGTLLLVACFKYNVRVYPFRNRVKVHEEQSSIRLNTMQAKLIKTSKPSFRCP